MMMRLSTNTTSFSPSTGKFREAAAGIFATKTSFFTSLQAPQGWCNSGRISRFVFPGEKISRPPSFSSTISANMSLPSKVVEHIVFFNVKEGTPPGKTNAMVSALQGLRSLDTVLQLTTGPILHVTSDTYKYTHALHSRYKDKQGLADYSGHPQHLSVVKELVLPIVDDIFAFDWEADLDGPMMPAYGALKMTVLNPKDLAHPQRFELVEILSGYKSIFPTIGQVSFGENFSPARAKGFTWGFLSLFPGVKELEELNKNEEHIKLQVEKVLPQMEKFMVVDMITNLASL
ncbi:hypothetical protein KI387_015206 [Taxus chinensis]|uniref:Stress-response A/B barrel domain-containing protein n=1 Tax=Taxus chinensis TaxID=29808 RepID=A0AA38GET3_TAXCH|nr:hypothetical protein KI387_015206 [Taxus chinensis]